MKAIITTICLISSFGLMFFAVWPEYTQLRQYIDQEKIKEKDLENMISYNQSLKGMVNGLQGDYKEKIKEVKSGIPNDHYIPSLLSEIKDLSYETGVKIINVGDFSINEYSAGENIKQVEIEIQVQGSYPNFKNFILRLENSIRIISVNSIRIEKSSRSSEEGVLESRLILRTYLYQPEE